MNTKTIKLYEDNPKGNCSPTHYFSLNKTKVFIKRKRVLYASIRISTNDYNCYDGSPDTLVISEKEFLNGREALAIIIQNDNDEKIRVRILDKNFNFYGLNNQDLNVA